MTKHAPRQAAVASFGVNNENARPAQQAALALKAGKPRAVTKKKRALADITNAAQSVSAISLHAQQTLKAAKEAAATGGVLRLAAENEHNARIPPVRHPAPAIETRTQKRDRSDAMQLDTEPQSPIIAPELRQLPPRTSVLPDTVLDIDAADSGNHLSESRFAGEIHKNLLRRECKLLANPEYMSLQRDITPKMRSILIDWLVDVHLKFELRPNTLHLTVNIIDRFLAATPVMRRKLQLVGITAMLIASKYEEIYAPVVADFVYISDKTYTEKEILSMEALVLNALKFEVTLPYASTFLARNLKAMRAVVGYDVAEVGFLSHYIVELALQDVAMLRFRHSQIAAAATLLSAKLVLEDVVWDDTMHFYSGGWDCDGLMECEMHLRRLLLNEQDPDNINKLTAIKRKYSSEVYGDIATLVASVDLSTVFD